MQPNDLSAEADIRRTIYQYCRGIDRKDYDLVRSVYHPDAHDQHGPFEGTVDEFIDYIRVELPRFERTAHSIANLLIDFPPEGSDAGVAWTEAYAHAFHRLRPGRTKPARDFTVGLRYVDRFEHRDGRWAIADRQCIFEWGRLDPVAEGFAFGDGYVLGQPFPDDAVYDRRRS